MRHLIPTESRDHGRNTAAAHQTKNIVSTSSGHYPHGWHDRPIATTSRHPRSCTYLLHFIPFIGEPQGISTTDVNNRSSSSRQGPFINQRWDTLELSYTITGMLQLLFATREQTVPL